MARREQTPEEAIDALLAPTQALLERTMGEIADLELKKREAVAEFDAEIAPLQETTRRLSDLIKVATGEVRLPEAAPARARSGSGQRAPRGQNRQLILTTIGDRPGVSVAEIASVTGIGKATVATTVSKLKKDGVIAPEGSGGVKLVTS